MNADRAAYEARQRALVEQQRLEWDEAAWHAAVASYWAEAACPNKPG